MSESFNPFQAPESDEHEVQTLADDTEFLISRSEILCRETVELPRVCFGTGSTDRLVEQQASLHLAGVTYGVIVVLAVGFVLAIPVWVLDVTRGRDAAVLGGMVTLAPGILVIFAFASQKLQSVFARFSVLGFRVVRVTWFADEAYLRRCHWLNWTVRGTVVPGMFYLGHLAGEYILQEGMWVGVVAGSLCGLASLGWYREHKPICFGQFKSGPNMGLYKLTGHSTAFMDAVERLIRGGY